MSTAIATAMDTARSMRQRVPPFLIGISQAHAGHREVCVNPYNKPYEEALKTTSGTEGEVTSEEFRNMIECNWPKESTEEDINAYYARFHIVLL